MVTDVNETYCDHFTMYTNIESLCCTPETNICQLYCQKREKRNWSYLVQKIFVLL